MSAGRPNRNDNGASRQNVNDSLGRQGPPLQRPVENEERATVLHGPVSADSGRTSESSPSNASLDVLERINRSRPHLNASIVDPHQYTIRSEEQNPEGSVRGRQNATESLDTQVSQQPSGPRAPVNAQRYNEVIELLRSGNLCTIPSHYQLTRHPNATDCTHAHPNLGILRPTAGLCGSDPQPQNTNTTVVKEHYTSQMFNPRKNPNFEFSLSRASQCRSGCQATQTRADSQASLNRATGQTLQRRSETQAPSSNNSQNSQMRNSDLPQGLNSLESEIPREQTHLGLNNRNSLGQSNTAPSQSYQPTCPNILPQYSGGNLNFQVPTMPPTPAPSPHNFACRNTGYRNYDTNSRSGATARYVRQHPYLHSQHNATSLQNLSFPTQQTPSVCRFAGPTTGHSFGYPQHSTQQPQGTGFYLPGHEPSTQQPQGTGFYLPGHEPSTQQPQGTGFYLPGHEPSTLQSLNTGGYIPGHEPWARGQTSSMEQRPEPDLFQATSPQTLDDALLDIDMINDPPRPARPDEVPQLPCQLNASYANGGQRTDNVLYSNEVVNDSLNVFRIGGTPQQSYIPSGYLGLGLGLGLGAYGNPPLATTNSAGMPGYGSLNYSNPCNVSSSTTDNSMALNNYNVQNNITNTNNSTNHNVTNYAPNNSLSTNVLNTTFVTNLNIRMVSSDKKKRRGSVVYSEDESNDGFTGNVGSGGAQDQHRGRSNLLDPEGREEYSFGLDGEERGPPPTQGFMRRHHYENSMGCDPVDTNRDYLPTEGTRRQRRFDSVEGRAFLNPQEILRSANRPVLRTGDARGCGSSSGLHPHDPNRMNTQNMTAIEEYDSEVESDQDVSSDRDSHALVIDESVRPVDNGMHDGQYPSSDALLESDQEESTDDEEDEDEEEEDNGAE